MKKELLKFNVYAAPSAKVKALNLRSGAFAGSFPGSQNEDINPEEEDLF